MVVVIQFPTKNQSEMTLEEKINRLNRTISAFAGTGQAIPTALARK
jgi:hypothetical protein